MAAEHRIAHASFLDATLEDDTFQIANTNGILAVAILAFSRTHERGRVQFGANTALYVTPLSAGPRPNLTIGYVPTDIGSTHLTELFGDNITYWLDKMEGFNITPVDRSHSTTDHPLAELPHTLKQLLRLGRFGDIATDEVEDRIRRVGQELTIGEIVDAASKGAIAKIARNN